MSMPFYVSPEQLMKDRADYARKGIARGRSVVVVQYADGMLFVAENPSQALHKVSEIYDRIAFAAVGRYNEFENLRIAGVRLADMRGYSYDRRDVTGRGLANAYAQTLGTIFSSGGEKPYEVEIVRRRGRRRRPPTTRSTGSPTTARWPTSSGYVVMGGAADVVADLPRGALRRRARPSRTPYGSPSSALGHTEDGDRVIPDEDLEVAVLDRTRTQPRKFRRITPARLRELLGERGPAEHNPEPEGEHSGAAQAAPPGAEGPPSSPVSDPEPGSDPAPESSRDDEPPIAPPA